MYELSVWSWNIKAIVSYMLDNYIGFNIIRYGGSITITCMERPTDEQLAEIRRLNTFQEVGGYTFYGCEIHGPGFEQIRVHREKAFIDAFREGMQQTETDLTYIAVGEVDAPDAEHAIQKIKNNNWSRMVSV